MDVSISPGERRLANCAPGESAGAVSKITGPASGLCGNCGTGAREG